MPPAALSVRGLTRTYGRVQALGGVDLDVGRGERFTFLGPSGSGKTTLLRLIAGFEPPDGGTVVLDGQPVQGLPPERRGLGVVFQDYALFDHRTVAENIGFGLRMRGMPRAQRRERVAEMLALVGLEAEADRRPDKLSGGQRQRVALARALAPAPRLLLLDEPLANLDRRLRESLRTELVRIHREVGITLVLVTHDQEEALTLSDRVGVLRAGRLEQVGTPVQVWQRPSSRFVAEFLGEMNLLAGRADGDGKAYVPALGERLELVGEPPPGGEGLACVRPEALRLDAVPGGRRGTVRAVAYAGGTVTYRVGLDGAEVLVREALPDGSPAFSAGTDVGVRVEGTRCRLLPR